MPPTSYQGSQCLMLFGPSAIVVWKKTCRLNNFLPFVLYLLVMWSEENIWKRDEVSIQFWILHN